MTRLILVALACFAFAAPAQGALVTTAMSDPNVPVSQGSPLATLFQNPEPAAQTVMLNQNAWTTLTVTDGSACPLTFIRRGTSRFRCTLPAGGAVLYSTQALSATTFTSAYSTGGLVLGSVAYLSTPTPFVATVYVISCFDGRPWAHYSLPVGCPVQP